MEEERSKKDSRYKDVKKTYSLLIGEFLRNPDIILDYTLKGK